MEEDNGENKGINTFKRSTGHADTLYRKFSVFVRRRSRDELGKRLYATNWYLEKIIAIVYANHHRNVALLAVGVYCCFHIYQVNIPIFACAIAALFCQSHIRQILLKIIGTYLSAVMIFHEIKPIIYGDQLSSDASKLILAKLAKMEDPVDKMQASLEAKQILNSMLVLMLIFLSCAMHKLELISGPRMCVLFPKIKRVDADKGAPDFFKFMHNFFFYKFGVEICWFAIALQLCLGLNAFDVGLCLMLWLTLVSRRTVHKFWPFIRAQVGIFMTVKYVIEASHMPVHATSATNSTIITALMQECMIGGDQVLAEYITGFGMMCNFFVVLLIGRQMWIFNGNWERYGGTNEEKWHDFDDPDVINEVEDYLLCQRTWLDVMKNIVLPSFPFVTLLLIIFSSMYSANLFSVSYIIAAGALLTLGPSKLFMPDISKTRRRFQYLMIYNLLVISAKFVICSAVNPSNVTEPFQVVLRVIFMDWHSIDGDIATIPGDAGELILKLSATCYIDAIYLGLLLLIRRFIESHYFLHFRREYRARDFLDEWGIHLQAKGAEMQLNKTTHYIAELGEHMENRLNNINLSSVPALKNANINRVVEIPEMMDNKLPPYGLTIWLWSTTLVFRFVEFGFYERLKDVKSERQFFFMEKKAEPTEEDLEHIWQQFERDNLFTILWKPRPFQLLQAFWTCLRAHSQLVCFLIIFYLQAFCYCSFYTLPLPLSVLYASKKYPRPHNYYWNTLLIYSLIIIIGKIGFSAYLGEAIVSRLGGPSAHWEAFLFVSIIWHRSILNSVGLWYPPLCYQIKPKRVAFVDVYACILVIQVVSTLIVLFNFSSFAAESNGEDGTVVELDSDSVPVTFMVIIFLHLMGMALDRIFYVSKAFGSRKIFHTIVFLCLHFWLFHFVPNFTHKKFGYFPSQQVYYFLQCIYLLLSAYQVRTCHSRCSAVGVLCQSFTRFNWVAFMIYSNIPFLEPVRRSIDFFFTKTLLTREEFVIIESIFDLVFMVKCERVNEFTYMTNRQFRNLLKTFSGLVAIFAMLVFIASPLIYFTMEDTMTGHNHLKYLSLELSSPIIGDMYEQRTTQFMHISKRKYLMMKNHFGKHRGATTFLNQFGHEDVMVAKLPQLSLTEWTTTQPKEEIANQLRNISFLRPTIKWVAEREFEGDEDFNDHTTMLRAPFSGEDPGPIFQLADMIQGNNKSTKFVVFPDLMPKFLVFHRADPSSSVKILMITKAKDPTVDDLLVSLEKVEEDKHSWKISENCFTEEYRTHTSKLPFETGCNSVDIFIFSAHPPLVKFTKNIGGLLGLYVGVILSLWKYLSKLWKRDPYEIMFEEMVCPDKILQLCLDIYQCRITQQAKMELDLGQKLLNIFTSSSEFEKWTQGSVGVDARAVHYSFLP